MRSRVLPKSNGFVVVGVDLDDQFFHAAIIPHLDRAVGRKVFPELSQVLAVIVA